jgi:hypothetical protein
MKRFTLFLLVLLLSCPMWVQAQLSKGTWYTSGSKASSLPVAEGLAGLSYFDELGTIDNLVGLNISPEFGYFFSRRLLAGSRVSLSLFSKNDVFDGNSIAVEPFVRYYLNPGTANNHFFVNAQLNILSSSAVSSNGASIGVGMTHFLAPGIGLDAYLAVVEPNFEIRRNTQLGLSTSLNVYLNPELKGTRKTALPDLQRGTLLVGGTSASARIGITEARPGTSNLHSLNIAPNLLYFVNSRFALGGALALGLSGNQEFSTTLFGLSPKVRYYLNTDRHRLLFLSGAYHYDLLKAKIGELKLDEKTSRASLALGLNSFFTSNLALELAPNVNYNFDSESLRVGLDFGIQFFLNPKRKE